MALISRHWYPLSESGDAFLKSARFRYEQSVETTAPAERIWEILTGYDLLHWVPVWTGLRWGSPPFGVGTVREVTLVKVFTVRERFFRWIEGQRYSFSGLKASLPGLRSVAEDWVIEPTSSGSRLTWTLAIGAHPWAVPLVWLSGPIIRGVQRRGLRTLRVHMGN
ncbi:SRPBCC family protein [Paeniglutamicibacter sp. NPDC091659]|uniref:SRPBCC family protein n=1 Tax=Paeniglutamicibacter sp. NPDC091659 TaxID=3364389 RepID=UPI0037F78813